MAAPQLELPQLDKQMPLYRQENADKINGKRLQGSMSENGVEEESGFSKPDVTKGSGKSTSTTNGTTYNGKKFKGVKVCCGDLRQYLHSMETYRQASMLRKGREVHKVYVDVRKGSSFLEDRFSLTEFGRVVLQDGCVRAGRARNVRHIVVARETLYCSGTGGCRRACGGYGVCVVGCDKVKVRGHKCSFRVKLTMRLGFVDHWFVEIMGSHNCYIVNERESAGRGSNELEASPPPSDMDKMLADYELKSSDGEDSDLTGGLSQGPPSAAGSPLMVDSIAAAAQAGVLNLLQSGAMGNGKFLPAGATSPPSGDVTSASPAHLMGLPASSLASSSFPMLLSPAHCPINVPLFSDSYIEAMARNAAAAVAMSECGVFPPSSASVSPLSSPMKKEGAIVSPSPSLPKGLGIVGADAGGSYPGGFLPPPPILLPRFGFLPPLPLAPDGKPNLHMPPDEKVMDLSTPKHSKSGESIDNSTPQDLSAKKALKTNGHSSPFKRTLSPFSRQASTKSPSSAIPPSGIQTTNQNQTGSRNTDRVLPQNSSPQHQNGNSGRGSHPKRQRKSTPCPSYAISSFAKSSGLFSIQDSKNSIPSPPFLPKKEDTVTLSPNSTPSSPRKVQSSMSLPLVPSTSTETLETISSSIKTSDTISNITNCSDRMALPSSLSSLFTSTGLPTSAENAKELKIGCPGLNNSKSVSGKPMDKDLANRVRQLEAHVTQLRNLVIKADGSKTDSQGRRKPQREFDFNRYNTRHVALKVAYLGWDYQGFVVQEDTEKTVEAALFDALLRTKLIVSRETSNYHRCGRTDKGVSSSGQVISIDLRSNLLSGVGVKERPDGTASTRPGDNTTEIRYAHILNKVLPPEIRVLAWAPVNVNFSARFSCKKRTYKYYFPRGNLDIEKMKAAAQKLIGEHDFRNLCKMDVGNGVVNFMRKILKVDISILDSVPDGGHGYSMCELTVVGQAFLWHQIRCIVAILILIGQGKEEAEVIDHLLNVEENPRKPQYTMASEIPLNLFDCEYDDDLDWVYEADVHEDNIRHFQQIWAQHSVRTTMLKRMLDQLDVAKVETESDIAPWNELSAPVLHQTEWITPGNKPRVYKPLFKRSLCESLEERIEHFAKRSKIMPETDVKSGGEAQDEQMSTSPPLPTSSSPSSSPLTSSVAPPTTATTTAAAETSSPSLAPNDVLA